MKRVALMISVVMFCIIFAGCGEETVLQYKALGNGTDCAIVGVDDKTMTKLVIPAELNGLRVTQIEWAAFSNCTELKSVELPETLEIIGPAAFSSCTKLKSIEVPEAVKKIGLGAFADCTELKEVIMKEGLETISGAAFQNCTELVTLEIPASVSMIFETAFKGCVGLENIKVADGNQAYTSKCETGDEANVIIGKMNNELIVLGKELVIPDGIEEIGAAVFDNHPNITSLTIPESVGGAYVSDIFEKCKLLNTIYGKAGSSAEAWAKEKGINFAVIEDLK